MCMKKNTSNVELFHVCHNNIYMALCVYIMIGCKMLLDVQILCLPEKLCFVKLCVRVQSAFQIIHKIQTTKSGVPIDVLTHNVSISLSNVKSCFIYSKIVGKCGIRKTAAANQLNEHGYDYISYLDEIFNGKYRE